MDWVILDGSSKDNISARRVTDLLTRNLENKKITYNYFDLEDMNILACTGCGSCGSKTPGRCGFEDEIPSIIKAIANSKGIILLTPITFGGYSSLLKKAVDKFTLIGLPLYTVKNGNLLHPMRYGYHNLIGVGVGKDTTEGQKQAFKLLIERNALNMQSPHHKAITISLNNKSAEAENEIMDLVKEVSAW
ncbi:NAD(P)H-dependent oxidoreductase [Alkaliphilus pronyensis]|uniref:NAD(P)H-dependent oxidoreductase n=1 Tax=Alkaliphilus pronyensis TaxID=1482732 RepID=A0A6I0F7U8_9FIRM|nr:NAD(P)H-dependent oxidoreductase [Alkaliphilus pronyensis]KAB3536039.1 NAD(P)H-dependent oxidoreductase [Alkaliphilus pronyensis]